MSIRTSRPLSTGRCVCFFLRNPRGRAMFLLIQLRFTLPNRFALEQKSPPPSTFFILLLFFYSSETLLLFTPISQPKQKTVRNWHSVLTKQAFISAGSGKDSGSFSWLRWELMLTKYPVFECLRCVVNWRQYCNRIWSQEISEVYREELSWRCWLTTRPTVLHA